MKNKILNIGLVLALMALGCSKEKITTDDPEGSGNMLKSTATIDASTTGQYIRGFGGASILGWRGDMTSTQRTLAFTVGSGYIGLSVLRVRIPTSSSDFSAEKTTIDAAKNLGATVIASCWSAPASMKSNSSVVGGILNSSSYSDYAAYLKSYNTAVGGVTAISPWNEPNLTVSYESMNNTAAQIGSFISSYGASCGTKIMAPETYNMSQTFTNTVVSAAGSNLSYVCGHIYGVTPSSYSPGKEVWMTEHITDTNDANTWSGAMNTAKEIHNCMVAGYSMYVWWYIVRYYGLIDESSVVTKRGWVVSHFARFIRPGYYRVSCTANPTSGVYTTAYKSGSSLIVVAINTNSSSTYQAFSYSGVSISGFNRYKTTSSANFTSDSFAVSGGSFGITLPASGITTLVSY
jgi:glucuronoarabinoxylan endo-1,4-beta-xylanase